MLSLRDDEALVVGSGLAGLTVALRLADRNPAGRITLLTKTAGLAGGSSLLAQGGIAAALGAGDTPAAHAADTVAAGAGFVDPAMAAMLAHEGARRVAELLADGLPFDRAADGTPLLGREAAHGAARIVHAGGDATGRTLVEALAARVRATPAIAVAAGAVVTELVVRGGRVHGLLARHPDGWVFHRCARVVLATGGIGAAFARTTNPPEATGDGLALAARAGALLGDVEFVQFHPTALAADGGDGPAPLLTEALRGAGAVLLDGDGRRFMADEHPLAELAPRDVVARAIGRRVAAGRPVRLDLRPALAARPDGFPTVLALCAAAGFDPAAAAVPVAPAAHYHMGGVWTDGRGRTTVRGLWACGEVACTGVHGANRLASNSLLETLVFGGRVADDVTVSRPPPAPPVALPDPPAVPGDGAAGPIAAIVAAARRDLYEAAGLVRDGAALRRAGRRLDRLAADLAALPPGTAGAATVRAWSDARNALLAARLVVHAAEARRESRGAHFRSDFPAGDPHAVRHVFTLDEVAGQPAPSVSGETACFSL
ncbi:L-aspartate oxidase [Azospirillum sp. A39]|uniref:L-aspartate oxidase n=1 Tax=Azospirillum sp. A39 TaxID=3462279 RepID=UPI0040458263